MKSFISVANKKYLRFLKYGIITILAILISVIGISYVMREHDIKERELKEAKEKADREAARKILIGRWERIKSGAINDDEGDAIFSMEFDNYGVARLVNGDSYSYTYEYNNSDNNFNFKGKRFYGHDFKISIEGKDTIMTIENDLKFSGKYKKTKPSNNNTQKEESL